MCLRRFPAPVYGLPPSAHCGVDLFLHLSASRAGESAQTTEVRADRSCYGRPGSVPVHLGTVHHQLVRPARDSVLDN